MAHRRQHVFKVGDLAVLAMDARIDDQRHISLRQIAAQTGDNRNGAVSWVVDAEDELQRGVILFRERAQVLIKARLRAMQRLQHRNRRLLGDRRQWLPGKPQGANRRGDERRPGRDNDDQQSDCRAHRLPSTPGHDCACSANGVVAGMRGQPISITDAGGACLC